MARGLTASVIAQLSAGRVNPVIFVQIDFNSGTSYIHSGIGNISWNAQTWVGVGKLGSVSPIPEDTDVVATGITLSLSGIPSDLLGQVLTECRQGKAVKVWFGFLDSAGAVIADPFQSFAGRMDVPAIDEGGQTSTVSITVENALIDLNRNKERRYTHQDQQLDFSGDLGFEFVPAVQDWNGIWGKGTAIPRGGGGGGSGGLGGGQGDGGSGGGGGHVEPNRE